MTRTHSPEQPMFPAGAKVKVLLGSYADLTAAASGWQLESKQLSRGRYSGKLLGMHTARTQFVLAEHGCGTRIEGHVPPGTIVLCLPFPTADKMQFRGSCLRDGAIFAHDSAHGIDFSFLGPITIFSLAVQKNHLEQRAARLWQTNPQGVSTSCVLFDGDESSARVREALRRRLNQAMSNPHHFTDSGKWAAFEDAVIDEVLAAIPEPRDPEPQLARRRIARRVASMLHECCREDLSVSDLCAAARASRRTLHLGFMELYGMGPMGYLRVLRLNGVRQDLRGAPRSCRSITDIATSWGFTHLGRFAGAYRAHFGVLPSSDLAALGRVQ